MSLTEEQRARMERMKKVAQEKKKWKDKAALSGNGVGESGAPSGGRVLSTSGGSSVQSGRSGVPSGQGGDFQKAPVVVEKVFHKNGTWNLALAPESYSTSNITNGSCVASISSSSGRGSSNHQSSIAGKPAPTSYGGSVAATKPASAFYKPQAAQPPLSRGNFRPQEQPSNFKHQPPSKVFFVIFM